MIFVDCLLTQSNFMTCLMVLIKINTKKTQNLKKTLNNKFDIEFDLIAIAVLVADILDDFLVCKKKCVREKLRAKHKMCVGMSCVS